MSVKKFLFIFVFSCLAIGGLAVINDAAAQSNGGDNTTSPSSGLLSDAYYNIRFRRVPGADPGQINMRISRPGAVSGCAKTTEPEIEIKRVMNKMRVEVTEPKIKIKNDKVRYGQYSCDPETLTVFFDVTLDRDELIEYRVKSIQLKIKDGATFEDKITVSKDKIDLYAMYPWGQEIVTYWFYPENTVILEVPAAKSGQDVKSQLREYAIRQGLVPLEKTLKGFVRPDWITNIAYFTDPSGVTLRKTGKAGENKKIGEMVVSRSVFTADGKTDEPYAVGVFARKPGEND